MKCVGCNVFSCAAHFIIIRTDSDPFTSELRQKGEEGRFWSFHRLCPYHSFGPFFRRSRLLVESIAETASIIARRKLLIF